MNDEIKRRIDELAERFDTFEVAALRRLGADLRKVENGVEVDTDSLARKEKKRMNAELIALLAITAIETRRIYRDMLTDLHKDNAPLFKYRGIAMPKAEKIFDSKEIAKDAAFSIRDSIKSEYAAIIDENGKRITWNAAYKKSLQKAVDAAQNGGDIKKAIRESVKEIGGSGLKVEYGSGITRRLDTVVRQTVLYYAKQAAMSYQDSVGEILGCDGIEIDYHSSPRPSHEFMQGKQYHIGGDVVIDGILYEDASEALERLEDYNCYHYKTPIICGVSVPRYSPDELERLKAEDRVQYTVDGKTQNRYGWTQDLRKLEAATRSARTEYEMAKSAGERELARQCREQIAAYRAKYDEICEVTGIAPDYERMRIIKIPYAS